MFLILYKKHLRKERFLFTGLYHFFISNLISFNGNGRSAGVIIAYLMKVKKWSYSRAEARLEDTIGLPQIPESFYYFLYVIF